MEEIQRKVDYRNLVRELANNKVDALELVREALANAHDHGAQNLWLRTIRGAPPAHAIDVRLVNDGEGMSSEQLSAFWGVSASIKPGGFSTIGYKGHGTKLYFASRRLSVATRRHGDAGWTLMSLDRPLESELSALRRIALPQDHALHQELEALDMLDRHGVAIWIEGTEFSDAKRLLSRRTLESYCDWFTVIGDIRAGLFRTRTEFHEVVHHRRDLARLRTHEAELRPMTLHLRINGETSYRPMGLGPLAPASLFLGPWKEDVQKWEKVDPGLIAFGHRFADHHEAEAGARRLRDDRTALCLTSADTFMTESPYSLVIRVEGQRRQLEWYVEGSRQGASGEYDFSTRFGLWLCKDFIPVEQRNDLLEEALLRATEKVKKRMRFDLSRTRFWQVFVNHQAFVLTANRNSMANAREHSDEIVKLVASRIADALQEDSFREWIENLQRAVLVGKRDKELDAMNDRLREVTTWFQKEGNDVELAQVTRLEALEEDASIRLPRPTNEQELFYLYAVLTGRFRVPLRVIEYETRFAVDAVAQVVEPKLFDSPKAYARVEFKYQVQGNRALGHFFDAIDAIVCWNVTASGDLPEAGDAPLSGRLGKRKVPRLASGLDTYEIVYTTEGKQQQQRVLPVLELEKLFTAKKGKRR